MASDDRLAALRRFAGLTPGDLQALFDLFDTSDLLDLDVAFKGGRFRMERESVGQPVVVAEAQSAALAARAAAEQPIVVTSPLVGIFHPAVEVGEEVRRGQTLGAIEALGLPTTIDAPRSGVVDEVVRADGSPVEYGQPLLILRRPERE